MGGGPPKPASPSPGGFASSGVRAQVTGLKGRLHDELLVGPSAVRPPTRWPMRTIHSTRGGIALDIIVALGLVLLVGFALDRVGVSLPELLSGFRHFVRG
jgi:hypothetical protein